MSKNLAVFSVLAALLATTLSYADVCQINSKPETVQNALAIIQKNYPNASEVKLVINDLKRPSLLHFERFEVIYKDLKVGNQMGEMNGRGPYFLWATLANSETKIWIDLAFTYYLDQTTGKYTNLGVASNCQISTGVEVYPTLD